MTPGRTADPWRCLLLVGLFCRASCQSVASTFENETGQTDGIPRVFSPRMDYDEWTPLGRGDPLKNNPTFDYVPPVLDRVQYWLDSHTTEPSAKRDILVLGVTAKKTSPKLPEQMLKFVDGPKFTRSKQQGVVVSYRNEFTGSTGAEPPKIVRTSSFRNGPPIDYNAAPNGIRSAILSTHSHGPFYDGKIKPYTMMLPPPLSQKDTIVASFGDPSQRFDTQTEEGPVLQDSRFRAPAPPPPRKFSPSKSTVRDGAPASTTVAVDPSVSFEKSNLIYQSTQTLSGGWPAASTSAVPLTTRFPPDYSRDRYEFDHRVAAASSNHEVVVEQNANIIVDGESGENGEVVVGQKGSIRESEVTAATATLPSSSGDRTEYGETGEEATTTDRTSEKMHIVVADSSGGASEIETSERKRGPVTVVMPTNYSEKRPTTTIATIATTEPAEGAAVGGGPIYTGTDEMRQRDDHRRATTMGPFPSRHLGHPMTMHPQPWPSHGSRAPASIPMLPPMTRVHAPHNGPSQILQRITGMFPPAADGPPPIDRFFDRHRTRGPDPSTPIFGTPTPSPFLPTVAPAATDTVENSVYAAAAAAAADPAPHDGTLSSDGGDARPSTEVTTVPSLTTDPIFSHYKQPAKPIRGPMYLIIQGHSKVKTYKPTVSKHGTPVEGDGDGQPRHQPSKFERFVQESARRNAAGDSRGNAAALEKKKAEEKARVEKLARTRQNDLTSLVDSGVGGFEIGGDSTAVPVASS